ncbi:MAG: DegT/DnrJ/EryC1/StrS aminotransferase [Clostridiales bacterium]|jgi:dTDP-4-amino-4,6-dideoxygalactose transaminase|nr:DegT/DnrJ/EryC1/StrS aminotransferase [Clostridiales bacterium]
MILVNSPFLPPIENYVKKLEQIWKNQYLTNNGPLLKEFNEKLAIFLDISPENISLFVNGHLALEAAIKALDLKGEVITTPFTFASTTNAIVNCGLKPVFCDIDPETLCIDHTKIEELITERTSAILGVHVFGNLCNIEEIDRITQKYNLKVIYDAAHAFGIKYKGKSVFQYGDVSMASFHATKVFHSIEGGMVCYKNQNLKQKFQLIKNFGINNYDIHLCGSNMKMNEFQAAMGLVNLEYLDNIIKERKKIYERYTKYLLHNKKIKIVEFKNETHNYIYMPIILPDDININELLSYMEKNNIQIRRYFYPLTSKSKYLNNYIINTPVAEKISEKIICLPFYYGLKESEQIYIIEKLSDFLEK